VSGGLGGRRHAPEATGALAHTKLKPNAESPRTLGKKRGDGSGVTETELDDAAKLGVAILTALGTEGNPSASEAMLPVEELRLRSYSMLYRAYDGFRRAMAYLRWDEDDANDFAPPLTGPRGPRAKKEEPKGEKEEKGEKEGTAEAKKDDAKGTPEAKKDDK
jgi:hypothetical protein